MIDQILTYVEINAIVEMLLFAVILAGVIVALRHIRSSDRDLYVKEVVNAVEQKYGQLDGEERLEIAKEYILSKYPRMDADKLDVAIHSAVKLLNLAIKSVQAKEQAARALPQPAPTENGEK